MVATPIGLLLCFIGLLFDKNKNAAIWGLAAIGILVALFLLVTLC